MPRLSTEVARIQEQSQNAFLKFGWIQVQRESEFRKPKSGPGLELAMSLVLRETVSSGSRANLRMRAQDLGS